MHQHVKGTAPNNDDHIKLAGLVAQAHIEENMDARKVLLTKISELGATLL